MSIGCSSVGRMLWTINKALILGPSMTENQELWYTPINQALRIGRDRSSRSSLTTEGVETILRNVTLYLKQKRKRQITVVPKQMVS